MQHHSAPPGAGVIHRSTILKVDPSPSQNPPPVTLNTEPSFATLPGATIPSEVYQQLGMLPNSFAVAGGSGGALFDHNGALLPNLNFNYAQMESMLAMSGIPLPEQHQQQLVVGDEGGPISEAARKEAAAAARAARQAKRKEEKERKQVRQRKTSNDASQMQAIANAELHGVAQPGPLALPTASLAAAAAAAQPAPSQQQPTSSRRKRANSTEDQKTEQRAIKNRESAARSRAKRVERISALEVQVEELRSQNKTLRTRVITSAAAPPDQFAGTVDGKPLRRTRTMPL
jgi:hypothetical protein